jgi:hypothetical protein
MEKKFEIKSGKIVLSDPSYTLGTRGQGVVDKVKNGEWVADVEFVVAWGKRISTLTAHHKNFPASSDEIQEYGKLLTFDGGVDSGQFGYFDFDGYRKDETIKDIERVCNSNEHIICANEPWYSICCDRTLGKEQWGVIPLGVISTSGYGDGSYSTFGIKNDDGEYVGFTTIFINFKEREEDKDDMFPDDEVDPAGGHGLHSHE